MMKIIADIIHRNDD